MLAQLPSEIFKVSTAIDAANIQEHFVDTILLNAGRQFFQMCHDPVAQTCVQLIITGKRKDFLRELHCF
ncbi:hypothetical protein SDC9_176693 [bioreactor metagenome]|uniref:Uncharacterized protein n=1 Tax=bioreactor metagenome TaxID=1076179 RepID=A0A645GTF5_9ZZZZ